jgi:hypothetical protein
MTPPDSTEVVVSVDDAHAEEVSSVADGLRSAGMEVSDVSPELGVVTGRVNAQDMDRLSSVEGVAAVERSREVGVPPPDEPVQ